MDSLPDDEDKWRERTRKALAAIGALGTAIAAPRLGMRKASALGMGTMALGAAIDPPFGPKEDEPDSSPDALRVAGQRRALQALQRRYGQNGGGG